MDLYTWNLIVAAAAGLVGGQAIASVNRNISLGLVGNTVTGVLGGGVGGLLGAYVPALEQIGSGTFTGANVGTGALGGLILTALVGILTNTGG